MADQHTKDASKRDRSPKFPYISLATALERIRVLYTKVRRHEARVADIAPDWNLTATSSSTDRVIAALQSYGLVDASGPKDGRKIKLTEDAVRILDDGRPGIREGLLAKAALRPRAIAEYAALWIDGRPDDVHALSQLKFEGGFTDDAAKLFLRVFDDTIRFTKGFQPDKNPDTSDGTDREDDGAEPDSSAEERPREPDPPIKRREVKVGVKEDVFSLREGDVTLQWPEKLSADSYQDLEDWTKLLLRKIKRAVQTDERSGEPE